MFCAVIGLYDVVQVITLNVPDSTFGLRLRPSLPGATIYPDFVTPYAAVHAYLEGKQALIYDHAKFTVFLNNFYGHRLELGSQWFLYPPVWILALLPLCLLPVNLACAIFMVGTAAASAFESRRHLWGWLAVATSPAAVWVVLSGQNSFLYIALIYGGMRLLDRAPVAAGMLLGLLVYKPQICLLVPLALLAARQWKALAWMLATGTSLVLASLAVFGLDFWLDYIDMTRHLSDPDVLDVWAPRRPTYLVSTFIAARILQLPNSIASALQFAAAILAAGSVWFAFRRHPSSATRTAVLAVATFLVSPYATQYDLILLLPAALVLYRRGAATGFYPLEPLLYPLLWVAPTVVLWLRGLLPLTPLVVLAFGLVAVLRLRAERSDQPA